MSYQIKYYQTAENDLIEITLYYLNQIGIVQSTRNTQENSKSNQ